MSINSSGKHVELARLTWRDVQNSSFEVAVLPWGATEAHNYHLPYATDNYQAEWIATKSARIANEAGARIVVLPTIPFGVNTQQLDIPLTINMNPSTQAFVLQDIVESLEDSGVRKLVIFNGHGGNHFRQTVRELQARTPLFLGVVDWFSVVPMEAYFDNLGDHAGEMETSVMMHIEDALVRPIADAGSGKANVFRIDGFRDGTAWAPRQWTSVTTDTGVGDPSKASAAKGAAYLEVVVGKIARFLIDLSEADPDDMYQPT